jgi:cysteine desulfurase
LRRCGYEHPPLTPISFGGGQERGLRPGTLPVALIVAIGKAAEIAIRDHSKRTQHCQHLKQQALATFQQLGAIVTGDQSKAVPSTLNVSIPGLDSEAVMVALKDVVAISNGSACTSQNYTASHVLTAMELPEDHIKGALRLSWCHLTPEVDWKRMQKTISGLM